MNNEFDVVVVGAGIAKLTAGATSAAGGASTLVLDAHRIGGRARTTQRGGVHSEPRRTRPLPVRTGWTGAS
jgi:phytoene dehydrogenase-like protein